MQRDVNVTPEANELTHKMLYQDVLPESPKAYADMNSMDVMRLVSSHDHALVAGMPAIEYDTLYFEVGSVEDKETLDAGSSSYGMRSGEELDMEVTVRYEGAAGTISMTHMDATAATETIYAAGGDNWVKIGGLPFGFDDYPASQSFALAATGEIVAVQIYVKCTDDTIPVDFRVELYAAETGSIPSLLPGDMKQYGETTAATVSAVGEWVTIKFKVPFPRAGATREFCAVVTAWPSNPTKVVYWYEDSGGGGYADGKFKVYNQTTRTWSAANDRDAYLKLDVLTEDTTNLVVNAAYTGWQEASADVTLRLVHDFYEKMNFADFYLTVPEDMAVNALCLRDKASGGEAHWRCDHVRTRHIAGERPEKRVTMWHDESIVTAGNALAKIHNANANYAVNSYQNASADNDSFTNGCYLRAGTYTFYVLGTLMTSGGIIDWTLDGVEIVAAQDWYNNPNVFNTEKSDAGVVVAFDGWHTLRSTVDGKNGASTGHDIILTKFWFEPAAD